MFLVKTILVISAMPIVRNTYYVISYYVISYYVTEIELGFIQPDFR